MDSSSSSSDSSSSTPPTDHSPPCTLIVPLSNRGSPEAIRLGPKRRRGKRITLLREQYSTSQRPLDAQEQLQVGLVRAARLSPTSTETRSLAGLELRAALTHDLLRHAFVSLGKLHSPGWRGYDGKQFDLDSPEAALSTAALLAVGAMTSRHSAIIGSVTQISSPSPDELVALDLGRRREGAVKMLARRAVQTARDSGILHRIDEASGHLTSLLRMTILFTHSDNPFMIELRDNLRFRQAAQPAKASAKWIASLISSDAFVGLMHGGTLAVSDKELTEFGLKDVTGEKTKARLEKARDTVAPITPDILADLQHLGILSMRAVVRLKTSPLLPDLPSALAQLNSLYATLDLILAFVRRVGERPQGEKFQQHILVKMPVILETTLVGQAARYAQAYPEEESLQELLVRAQCRFLNALARNSHELYTSSTEEEEEEGGSGYPKVTADTWSALDVFSQWDELAIEGAIQHGRGVGPLSQTAFGWRELERLHEFLKVNTATFAAAYPREQRFRRAWEAHQLELARRDVAARMFAPPGERGREALAECMVHQALVDLAA